MPDDPNHHAAEQACTLDAATARRLARLGDREQDAATLDRLKRNVQQALADGAPDAAPAAPVTLRPARWWKPLAGVAALLAITVSLVMVMSAGSPSAAASVLELSRLHEDLLTGRIAAHRVDSIEQANQRLTGLDRRAPTLPADLAGASVQSCCLVDVQGELVAVALLNHQDVAITLVVARATEFAHPMGRVFEIDGRTFFGHELNGIRMMMANLDDRWLCVMGDLPYPRLAELAAQLRF